MSAPPATPTFVQVRSATPQTPQSTVAARLPGAQTAATRTSWRSGWNDATSTITAVTDSAGNAYQVAAPIARGNGLSQAIYYAKNIKAAAAGTQHRHGQLSARGAVRGPAHRRVQRLGPGQPVRRGGFRRRHQRHRHQRQRHDDVGQRAALRRRDDHRDLHRFGGGLPRRASSRRSTPTSSTTATSPPSGPTAPAGRRTVRPAGSCRSRRSGPPVSSRRRAPPGDLRRQEVGWRGCPVGSTPTGCGWWGTLRWRLRRSLRGCVSRPGAPATRTSGPRSGS